MRHTKGPWTVFTSPSGYKMIRGPHNERISGDIDGKDCDDDENNANIQLISAAPDMLEALETICDEVTDLTFDQLCKVKSAIRKARGQ